MTVENYNTMHDQRADFHDGRILGYDGNRQLVCEKRIGDVLGRKSVTHQEEILTCDRLPEILTFDAAESPCESDVEIRVLYFDRVEDGEHIWDGTHQRRCDEGLPPKFRTESGSDE